MRDNSSFVPLIKQIPVSKFPLVHTNHEPIPQPMGNFDGDYVSANGQVQGYYFGLFMRFLWFLFITAIFQSMIIYIFAYNYFTVYILAAVFSFFINTSLPINKGYPFIRHVLIWYSLVFSLGYIDEHVTHRLINFYKPDWIWATMILISILVGILTAIGRYGRGTQSKGIETLGNLVLFGFIIAALIMYWWKGGVVYLAFRIPLLMLEVFVANAVLILFTGRQGQIPENSYIKSTT